MTAPEALGQDVQRLIGDILALACAAGLNALNIPDTEISPLAAANGRAVRQYQGPRFSR